MRWREPIALLMWIGAAATTAGCPFNALDDCQQNFALACFWGLQASGASSTGAGSDGGTPTECVPSENPDPVSDGCGVFVSTSGKDANEGTKESPVATLAKAVELAAKKGGRVYACAEMFEEALVLDIAVEVYGGLECDKAWAYVGDEKKTTLTAEANAIPLVMKSGVSDARIMDFAIHAADAVMEGGSSIAVLADGATAELVRCELVAGNGAKGSAGVPGDPNGMSAVSGAAGNSGANACSDLDGTPGPDATLFGGALDTNDCGSGEVSAGGRGGDGGVPLGSDGSAGQIGTAGQAGKGEPSAGMWSCLEGQGQIGSPGEAGMPGLGATGTGSISTSGYAGTSGSPGTPGKAGQGGGGGGGAKGGMICPGGVAGSGASGGSGGPGGCGGLPGQGGGPGGASIALVSLQASITLTDCTLTTGKGGDGGPGGDLQPGGAGGVSGFGGQGVGSSKAACDGGKGGAGGNGGPGGGGLGGPSLGIAFQGNAPERQGKTVVTPGAPGAGGPGGSVNVAMNAGEAGTAGEEQEFPE
jgi:hypothetical protein